MSATNGNLIVTQFSNNEHGEADFAVTMTSADSIEEAQEIAVSDGVEDANVIAFISLNHKDLGIRAFVTTLELSVEATHPTAPVVLEELLLAIFMAGRASREEKSWKEKISRKRIGALLGINIFPKR
jgi:hypothetical protein